MKLINLVSKNIIVLLAIVALATTLGISPALADWDKTKYPNIAKRIDDLEQRLHNLEDK